MAGCITETVFPLTSAAPALTTSARTGVARAKTFVPEYGRFKYVSLMARAIDGGAPADPSAGRWVTLAPRGHIRTASFADIHTTLFCVSLHDHCLPCCAWIDTAAARNPRVADPAVSPSIQRFPDLVRLPDHVSGLKSLSVKLWGEAHQRRPNVLGRRV